MCRLVRRRVLAHARMEQTRRNDKRIVGGNRDNYAALSSRQRRPRGDVLSFSRRNLPLDRFIESNEGFTSSSSISSILNSTVLLSVIRRPDAQSVGGVFVFRWPVLYP